VLKHKVGLPSDIDVIFVMTMEDVLHRKRSLHLAAVAEAQPEHRVPLLGSTGSGNWMSLFVVPYQQSHDLRRHQPTGSHGPNPHTITVPNSA
jgi:hypothetical protein